MNRRLRLNACVVCATGERCKGREQKCRALRSIHLRILRAGPPGVSKFILGYSNPLAPEGINVTIFGDAVESASIRYQASMSVILGHAIAHEIGHVLLRSGTHSAGGLMSASWTSREYFWMKSRLLRFSRRTGSPFVSRLRE